MAHDKVYGICENKCRVEVIPKCENRSMGVSPINIERAENGVRYTGMNVRTGSDGTGSINVYIPPDFDGYFEIVATRADYGSVKPSKYLDITGCYVKFINDNTLNTSHNVLYYKFYNNGLHMICECLSYAE